MTSVRQPRDGHEPNLGTLHVVTASPRRAALRAGYLGISKRQRWEYSLLGSWMCVVRRASPSPMVGGKRAVKRRRQVATEAMEAGKCRSNPTYPYLAPKCGLLLRVLLFPFLSLSLRLCATSQQHHCGGHIPGLTTTRRVEWGGTWSWVPTPSMTPLASQSRSGSPCRWRVCCIAFSTRKRLWTSDCDRMQCVRHEATLPST